MTEPARADAVPPETLDRSASVSAIAGGARVAGAVVALGYLTGFVEGPLTVVIGALGLISLGRALASGAAGSTRIALAFAALAVALWVPALRWETLDLGALRGVQFVLGPTLLAGDPVAVAATAAALGAALISLALWTAPMGERTRLDIVHTYAEVAIAGLAVATLFFLPSDAPISAGGPVQVLRWLGALVLVTAAAFVLVRALGRLGGRAEHGLSVSVAIVAVAASVTAGIV